MHPTSAAIGPGLPLAIGAALGTGKKTLLVQGDGGFMLHIGELATAAQYDLPLIICVFNDRGYGVLRRVQAMRFEGRMTSVDLMTPDFSTVARGMGIVGEMVKGVEEFRAAFERALDVDGPRAPGHRHERARAHGAVRPAPATRGLIRYLAPAPQRSRRRRPRAPAP